MPSKVSMRRPWLALALLCACKPAGPRTDRPDLPLPADIATLPAFDPAALADGRPPPGAPPVPLAVLDVGPRGRLDSAYVDLHVRFNQAVVPLGLDTPDPTPLFRVDPPLPGKARWVAPDLLVYDADEPLRDATAYNVTFGGDLRGLDGQRLPDVPAWTFESPRPQVLALEPYRYEEDIVDHPVGAPVFLEFDQPTTAAELVAHLVASATPLVGSGPAAAVPLTVRPIAPAEYASLGRYDDTVPQDTLFTVLPARRWPSAARVALELRPGLRGTVGPLPADTPWQAKFTTPRPQALESTTCTRADPCAYEHPVLRFRNPLGDDADAKISVTPTPLWFDAIDDGDREVRLHGAFLPGVDYTVRVAPGLTDSFGQTMPATARKLVFAARPDISLAATDGILPPDRAHVGLETHHIIKKVRVRVGLYDDAELAALESTDNLTAERLAALAFPARNHTTTVAVAPRGPTRWASQILDLGQLTAPLRQPHTAPHGVVLLEVTADGPAGPDAPPPVRGLYRVTDLMLVAHASRAGTVVRAINLSAGTPAAGLPICRLGPVLADPTCRPLGVTDRDGLLRADVPFPRRVRPTYHPDPEDDDDDDDDTDAPQPPQPPIERLRLVARDAHGDRTHLDLGVAPETTHWTANPSLRPGERLLVHLVRERGAYRPGERVRLVGWSAIDTPHDRHGLRVTPRGSRVAYTLRAPDGTVVAKSTGRTGDGGKFSATLEVPRTAPLGHYTAAAELLGDAARVHLQVEDYRVPEFSVTATPRRPDILAGESVMVDVVASYYFGGPVAITDATRNIECSPFTYRPPGLPAAWVVGLDRFTAGAHRTRTARAEVAPTAADPQGQRTVDEAPELGEPLLPHRCDVAVYVTDASAQGVGADTGLTVHPAPLYLAARTPDAPVYAGDRASVQVRAVTRDGDRVAARVRVDRERHWDEPIYEDRMGVQQRVDSIHHSVALPPCALDVTADGLDAACNFTADEPGTYRFIAHTTVDGRTAKTTTEILVTPRPAPTPPVVQLPRPRDLELLPSAPTVRPGERLTVLVRGPWNGAHGELVAARAGVRDVYPFVLANEQATITLTADDSWTPSVHLAAHLVAPDHQGLQRRRTAAAQVRQDAEHRRLRVHLSAPREARPGAKLPISVSVRDLHDRPVAAGRVALWAVDEAVLALTDEQLPDPLNTFVVHRRPEVDDYDDFYDLLLPYVPSATDPWLTGRGSGAGFGSRSTRVPAVRQAQAMVQGGPAPARDRFETTPLFLADVALDARGVARVDAELPDNMTTFRVTAVASAPLAAGPGPGRFGGAEVRTVVTAPLVLRPAAPRQLRPGDTAELAAIVENRTGAAGRVDVSAALQGSAGPGGPALEFLSKQTAHARVPAGGQTRLAFQVRALAPAEARLELRADFTARGRPDAADAVVVSFPVAPEPTLVERVAVHGTLTTDRAVQLPVQLPRGALPGHGGLELRASASLVAGLDDAARALLDYPYGCAEQTASRLIPMIALRDLELAVPEDLVALALARLASMQHRTGGFAYWPDGPVHPYATAYVTWTLQRAAAAGLPVPEAMLKAALDSLEQVLADHDLAALSTAVRAGGGPPLALALHALAEAGRDIDAPAAALLAQRAHLPLFARATLLLAVHRRDPKHPAVETLADDLLAHLSEGPSDAHTVERLPYSMDLYFHSDARTDALALLALLHARPDHPALPKLVRGLQDRRHGGAWRNTQENAHAILALAAWARLREPAVPDLQARVWLAGRTTLDVPLRGRDAATTMHADMADLLGMTQKTAGLLPVVLHRQGTGPLHYRLGVEWAPAGDDQPARDQGLAISRTLRDERGPLTRPAALGEPVTVDLELRAHQRVRYVVVDIPLPAGLEPIQVDLGHGRSAAGLRGVTGHWYTRQELRPDRVLLFIDDLLPGDHHHSIQLRATSRGTYAFPPAKAEAMYIPEIYGRTTATTLAVR